ncbi:MAG: hypothetical protein WCJ45_08135 [bacterium]
MLSELIENLIDDEQKDKDNQSNDENIDNNSLCFLPCFFLARRCNHKISRVEQSQHKKSSEYPSEHDSYINDKISSFRSKIRTLSNIEDIIYNFYEDKSDNNIDSSFLCYLNLVCLVHSRHHFEARDRKHDNSSKEGQYLEKRENLKK